MKNRIEKINWAKTLLSSEKDLVRHIDFMNDTIKNTAINSMYSRKPAIRSCEKVIDFMKENIDYMNIELNIRESIDFMKHTNIFNYKIISETFLNEKRTPAEKIAKELNISKRTYFRRLEDALVSYYNIVKIRFNYIDKESIVEKFGKNHRLIKTYKELMKSDKSRRELLNARQNKKERKNCA